jgi:hypothetical protein
MRLAQENSDWGAPKIHGELQKLGFVLSERTVARYLRRIHRRGDPAKKWLAFLHNHREAIVALDFFTVPTATFRVLYCFFVIEHERRRILHFNVTPHPSADWVVQQLRETFAEAAPYRYVILDRDSIFNAGRREDFGDPIKYIMLRNHRDDWYLSIGGETRQIAAGPAAHREGLDLERIGNDQWVTPYQNFFFLQRYMAHVDVHYGKHFRTFLQLKSGIETFRYGGPTNR